MKINVFIIVLSLCCFGLAAQSTDNADFEKARQEIKTALGQVPPIFQDIPEAALPGFWAYFQSAANPNGAIPPKYRELIQLGVAAQIPCEFCVYYHTESAKAFGATEAEIREAVYSAAATRNYSTLMYGHQTELEDFKKTFQEMMAYMAAQMQKKN